MTSSHIHLIAAARPNFMKIAPLYHALEREDGIVPVIVHTGQHYDLNMSAAFFNDLGLPEPDIHLGVGSGTHGEQSGRVMMAYEKILFETRPDMVVVVGDVNSTLACALAAVKISYETRDDRRRAAGNPHVRRPSVAHLEAGLRSFDRTMPEEINRLVTDAVSDFLWTPSPDADENLIREGVPPDKILRVGNIMIDSLEMMRGKIEEQEAFREFGLGSGNYAVVTLHRPSNVDEPDVLESICHTLAHIAESLPVVFPVHPRTRKNLDRYGLMQTLEGLPDLRIVAPLNYVRFMNLVFNCRIVITDSGGIQEETTYLGIPCLTLRPNTERPVTISQGTNRLCTVENLGDVFEKIMADEIRTGSIPEFWDGKTAERVVNCIRKIL